jgi:hypothetical protein
MDEQPRLNRDRAAMGCHAAVARCSYLVAMALMLIVAATGCGGAKTPRLGRVTGKVTLGGQPLPDALVTFSPETGTQSAGKTGPDGTYTLVYGRGINGAVLGEHTVTISTYVPEMEDPPSPAVAEKVPLKYREGDSLPKVTVKSGSNTLDFSLEPGPIEAPAARAKPKRDATGCF